MPPKLKRTANMWLAPAEEELPVSVWDGYQQSWFWDHLLEKIEASNVYEEHCPSYGSY